MKNITVQGLMAIVMCALSTAKAQQTVVPYTEDADTVLLDHFDGTTSANLLAYTANGQSCGSPLPSATPGDSFSAGPLGLNLALALAGSGDSGSPPVTRSYLKY